MNPFTKVVLYTAADGRAKWREEAVPLPGGTPQPQWVFILGGEMEIGLQDKSSRVFGPGQHFYSADVLPAGATFDPAVHGHWSAQRGAQPLVTLFVKG